MTRDEIKLALLNVCKVKGSDGDINLVWFHGLCDRLEELGAAAEREACAKVCEAWGNWIGDGQLVATAIRTRGEMK